MGVLFIQVFWWEKKQTNEYIQSYHLKYQNIENRISGQGRLDGAFCDYTENDKMEYLTKLHDFGVVNIEMECTIFAALTYQAGIRSAIVCVALLDRLKGDQVSFSYN